MTLPRKCIDSVEDRDDGKEMDHESALEIQLTSCRLNEPQLQMCNASSRTFGTYNPRNPSSPAPMVIVSKNIIISALRRPRVCSSDHECKIRAESDRRCPCFMEILQVI